MEQQDEPLSSAPAPDQNVPPASGSPTQKDPAKLERQLKIYKRIAVIAVVGCAAAFGWAAYSRRVSAPVQILLDGKPIVTVRNLTAANSVLLAAEQIKTHGANYPADSFKTLQKVQFRRVARDAAVDQDDTAARTLATKLKLHVRAFAILVDGHSTVGLPTEEMAKETLSVIKHHYESMPPEGATSGESEFVDKVAIERMGLDSQQLRGDPSTAAEYFWTPRQVKTYTVQPRDTGFSIAHKSHISFSDFLAANAGRDLNKLHPGDTVNVTKSTVLVHVLVHKQMQVTERMIANVPASEAGKQRTTYLVSYVNGHESKRRVLGMETLERPRTRTSL